MATRLQLSPHFIVEEFDCHDGTDVPDHAVPALIELCTHVLEPMRAKYGSCTVLSGYRTISHNTSVGGAKASQHVYEKHPATVAADVRFSSGTVGEWASGARWRFTAKPRWAQSGRGGVGDYPGSGFVHLDSATRRDWHG